MAKRATEDGHMTEDVGGVAVRRIVKKGAIVPDHWEGSSEDIKEGEPTTIGAGYEPVVGGEDSVADSPSGDPELHQKARADTKKRYEESVKPGGEGVGSGGGGGGSSDAAAEPGPVTSESASGKSQGKRG